MAKRTVMSQLASVGEDALSELAANPVTRRALEAAVQAKERIQKLVTGVDDLQKRVASIEKRLNALEKGSTSTKSRSATSKSRSTASKKSSS